MEYTDSEYHYTLYYYDQSGNLVRTVPPAGVKPFTTPTQLSNVVVSRLSNSTPQLPQHIMTTTYKHNALNAVVWLSLIQILRYVCRRISKLCKLYYRK